MSEIVPPRVGEMLSNEDGCPPQNLPQYYEMLALSFRSEHHIAPGQVGPGSASALEQTRSLLGFVLGT